MAPDRYVLGSSDAEIERLRLQHTLWLPSARAAWQRAGLQPGQAVLDLGAGPGFSSLELARLVGPGGRVLGLELSPTYLEVAHAAAQAAGLPQLELRAHNLSCDPLPAEGFQLAWCRWVAMFLPTLEPLLDGLSRCMAAGGRVVLHEYVHWRSFGLYPNGAAVARFAEAAYASFEAAGGDPDVNRRLPALLAARGFQIDALQPLALVGRPGDAVARWLERFVVIYGQELIRQGRWSTEEEALVAAEINAAHRQSGALWVAPTVLELQATQWNA